MIREGDPPLCSQCNSYFHSTENCRKQKSNDTPVQQTRAGSRRWASLASTSTPATQPTAVENPRDPSRTRDNTTSSAATARAIAETQPTDSENRAIHRLRGTTQTRPPLRAKRTRKQTLRRRPLTLTETILRLLKARLSRLIHQPCQSIPKMLELRHQPMPFWETLPERTIC